MPLRQCVLKSNKRNLGFVLCALHLVLCSITDELEENNSIAKHQVLSNKAQSKDMPKVWKPTREQIAAAEGKTVRDVIAPDLRVLFCGINPGFYTAAVGHHFARPGNRFWKALYEGGFTDRLLSPFDERELLKSGYGLTNVVRRATAAADQLTREEVIRGGRRLAAKVRRYRPMCLTILGLGAYRTAFDQPKATVGPQQDKIGDTILWVLPNPSGLNANYQQADLARLFAELRKAANRKP